MPRKLSCNNNSGNNQNNNNNNNNNNSNNNNNNNNNSNNNNNTHFFRSLTIFFLAKTAEYYEIEEIAISVCCLYEVNSWVAVAFGKMWYPGEVKSISDEEIEVLCTEKIGRASDSFVCPEKEDLEWYSYNEILCAINPPTGFSRQDLDKIYELMLQC